MANNPEAEGSLFLLKKLLKTPIDSSQPPEKSGAEVAKPPSAEVITVKDFFDFLKTAYHVYEHLEGDEDDDTEKVNWEELTKLTVLNYGIEQEERDLLQDSAGVEPKPAISKSESALDISKNTLVKRYSCSEIEGKSGNKSSCAVVPTGRVEMLGVWTETNLNCKLNDVLNEGILDSILPYLQGYKKATKTTSVYVPVIKKVQSIPNADLKKPASFGGFVQEKESKDRLGRRKSLVASTQENLSKAYEGDVEIHVCDEIKGLKKEFKCPQKLLVSKMGYFADVTAGQRLEDMDISVHCDIQIFDWLMRWVKRESILVADWPRLEPANVVPILVSASFLQMEPLLHDCLMYCHAHMSDIVKTTTNLGCLSDELLTRLAAMYTNVELEAVKDRKDKLQSRLYCKLIQSLAEPAPETLRGHHATLATLFKCCKCNKLLGRHIAAQVPCQPACMRIDRRGNVISAHTKDTSWSLSEYVGWLHGELRSWRRVYWRLWADCHFLKCQLCDTHFPVYQMEWCSHHPEAARMFATEARAPLPAGRHACCGERAYRFETLTRNTGCQFREHMPDESLASDAAVMEIYARHRDLVSMRPPQLLLPERLTRLVPRESEPAGAARLQCAEVFWWEGIQLLAPRRPLGLLGRLYTGDTKFNPAARPGSPPFAPPAPPAPPSAPPSAPPAPPAAREDRTTKPHKKGGRAAEAALGEEQSDSSASEDSSGSGGSEEEPPPRPARRLPVRSAPRAKARRARVTSRVWAAAQSARSNQDAQRRFEERATKRMRAALTRRAAPPRAPPGGIYAKLEAEWRERVAPKPPRAPPSARPRAAPPAKHK